MLNIDLSKNVKQIYFKRLLITNLYQNILTIINNIAKENLKLHVHVSHKFVFWLLLYFIT